MEIAPDLQLKSRFKPPARNHGLLLCRYIPFPTLQYKNQCGRHVINMFRYFFLAAILVPLHDTLVDYIRKFLKRSPFHEAVCECEISNPIQKMVYGKIRSIGIIRDIKKSEFCLARKSGDVKTHVLVTC